MSKAKDRARAESGIIFRNGSMVNREEWYAAHPTKQMRAETQAKVKVAVKAEMARKKLESDAVKECELAAPQGLTYFCTKCLKYHRQPNSAIYKAHTEFEDHNVPTPVK